MRSFLDGLDNEILKSVGKLAKEAGYFIIIVVLLYLLIQKEAGKNEELQIIIKNQTAAVEHTNDVLLKLTTSMEQNNALTERSLQIMGIKLK